MQKTVMIRVRVTEREFESIRHQMRVRGFSTVSAYVRSFALERDFWIEKKVQETYHLVKIIHDEFFEHDRAAHTPRVSEEEEDASTNA